MNKKNKIIKEIIEKGSIYKDIEKGLVRGDKSIGVTGLAVGDEVFFYQGLQKILDKPLFIIKEQQEAESLFFLMKEWLGDKVQLLPKRNILPYRTILKGRELKNRRIKILKDLVEGNIDILILSEESLIEKYIPVEEFKKNTLTLKKDMTIDRSELIESLVKIGFQKESVLEIKGQFTVRGDIVDIFPVTEENPVRLDFFDDQLEKIKEFDIENQRTIREIETIKLYPTSDLLPPENLTGVIEKLMPDASDIIRDELELMEAGLFQEENERFFPVFYDELNTILSYCFDKPQIIINNYSDLKVRGDIYYASLIEDYTIGEKDGLIHPIQKEGYINMDPIDLFAGENLIHTALFDSFESSYNSNYHYEKKQIISFQSDLDKFVAEVLKLLSENVKIYLFSSSKEKSKSLEGFFEERNLVDSRIYFLEGYLEESFILYEQRIALIGEKTIFGHSKKTGDKKRRKKLNPFIDIKEGDYVVHDEYGIAHYKGIEQKEILGHVKDYLVLQFHGTGRLFLPVEKMDVIEKYIGAEGHKPRLSNLSNNEWRKTKEKVRISVSDIAKDLLQLYSQRKQAKGFAFSKDVEEHRDFADRFPYIETVDQEKAIDDVRKDMEKTMPMDRVIIGDVGYGKTEVALRAAFKAVMDGKQVALLSPTTVLSQQHYRTFLERFQDLPFNIGIMNRFVHKNQQKKVLEGLADGQIDILIGTHRILSNDILFKDLGLLVIDEEQKFGVVHKEKIKNLKNNIDCLVLSATPIPRTLHMALAGARDLSVIETAPKERYPVQTYVLEHDDLIVRNSILKELKRQGQIFYVYNKVQTIEAKKRKLEELIPEATIGIAHGQMNEKTLESRMMGFMEGEIDILLCTTLIENGLNIRNANTLIVDEADNLGLAQIYQLKGRVGRSNRVAYAYFMFNKHKILSETAQKRLKAVRELTELGSGFKIAMLDLEIRGAGNLLGKEQHGHMVSVGFDLYCKILEDEVNRLADSQVEEESVVELDLNIDGHLPSNYIGDDIVKVEIYKKIADVTIREELLGLIDEVTDRFGPIPTVAENLFLMANIRILAHDAFITKIKKDGMNFIVYLKPGKYNLDHLQKIRQKFKGKVRFNEDSIVFAGESKLYLLEHFLKELK